MEIQRKILTTKRDLKEERCFIAIAFQFSFRICHQENPRKSSLFGIEWDTSATGLC
jgi:hypothetical protein